MLQGADDIVNRLGNGAMSPLTGAGLLIPLYNLLAKACWASKYVFRLEGS